MMSIPEIEITQKLNLTEQQNTLVVMHSIKNATTILMGELYSLGNLLKDREALAPSTKMIRRIIDALDDSKGILLYMKKIQDIESAILKNINEVLMWHPEEKENDKVNLILDNINSIFKIIVIRAIEILSCMEHPERWETFGIDELNIDFINFFIAVEKNSKGRYRIVYNLAQQNADSYFINLTINSIDGKTVYMPPIFRDVMRDLMANARKYTDPGGVILAGLFYDEKKLRFVVQDNGRGIPEGEMEKVICFGKRGSNVSDIVTKGGGFGLTKAYFVTKHFGGRMWIKSSVGWGTHISIEIPAEGNASEDDLS